MSSRKRRLRCQWAACSAGVDAGEGGGGTPSPCISSRSSARLSARSKAAVPAAMPGSAAARPRDEAGELELAAERRHRRRGGRGPSGSSASSVTTRMRGSSRAGPRRRARSARAAARRVLTQISTRATASGGWPARRASRPATSAREKSTPGRQGEDARAVLRREERHRASARLGEGDAFGPADVDPAARMHESRSRPAAIRRVPDRVERETSSQAASAAGSMICAPA